MRHIAQQVQPLHASDTGDVAYARFDAEPDCLLLPVVDENHRPVGLVERSDFLTRLASQYGRSVYGSRPIALIMDTNPLIVDVTVRSGDFASEALEQFSGKLLNGFIVVAGGTYLGVGTIIDLLKSTMRERLRSARRLEQLAHFDPLTGLANRSHLHDALEEMLREAGDASPREIALLAVDLDRFKLINDSFGHDAGDQVLQEVSNRLRSVLRPCDLAARLGGDEFAVVIQGTGATHTAELVAERIARCLKEPFVFGDKVMFLGGGSVGISVFPEDSRDVRDLLKFADMALYCAKTDCKGSWRRFCSSMRAGLEKRGALEADLRSALARSQLEVYLQPIQCLKRDEIVGYEALIRWNHPVHGYIAPPTFIPMAEDIGLICEIGEWMIEQACMLLAGLPEHLWVSVNVSSVQFRLAGLVKSLQQALGRHAIAPRRLLLEITESVLMSDEGHVLESLDQLRALGIGVALDDFGTGYASFAYLQRFSFDKIKVDRSFIAGLPHSPQSRAIVSAVSVLASQLDLTVVAEGVETEAQLAAVRNLGCQEAQGYLIGRPARVDLGSARPPAIGQAA